MSTFEGTLSEIPGISIDRFDGKNLNSTIFFLSHCHTDHCEGIMNRENVDQPFYTSKISEAIVRDRYKNVKYVRGLEIGGK